MNRAVLCSLLIVLSGCDRVDDASLAARGAIDERAPVKAMAQITINASAASVWSTMVSIDHWAEWQPDITATSMDRPPSAGTAFNWSMGGGHIHSRIRLFDPGQRLSWTGRMLVFHAIHVWRFRSLPDGRTLVATCESMSGWPIGLLFSSKKLLESDQRWLVSLKRKAEMQALSDPTRGRTTAAPPSAQ